MTGVVNDIYDNIKNLPENIEIAIWGLCQEGFHILNKAVNARVKVNYFIDVEGLYNGPAFFGKEVRVKDEVAEKENVFVLVSNTMYEADKEWIHTYLEGRYDVIGIDQIDRDICNAEYVYIYGAGDAGKRTLQILNEKGIIVSGFIDSNEEKVGKEWCDYPIYHKSVLGAEDVVIISTIYYSEIYDELSASFNKQNIFIDYRNSRASLIPIRYYDMDSVFIRYKHYPIEVIRNARVFYSALLNDFCGKEIIIYGANEITNQIVEIFELLEIRIACIVEESITGSIESLYGYQVREVYDLAYENLDNTLILVTKVNQLATEKHKKIVIDEGEFLENMSLKFFGQWRGIFNVVGNNRRYIGDKLLDYVGIYEGTEEKYTGFYLFGKKENCKRKIVVLGGSTSDPGSYENLITYWTEYLAQKFDDVIVYTGGISGYDVTKECLKLLRDVRALKPDLIISYSGVNESDPRRDSLHPFVKTSEIQKNTNMWFGIEDDIEPADLWILMERYMQAISNINGIDFISILQPSLFHKKRDDLSTMETMISKIFDSTDERSGYLDITYRVREVIPQFDWMYDLTQAFDEVKETVYRDFCHLTNRGNEIIADKVYDIINDYYSKKGEV